MRNDEIVKVVQGETEGKTIMVRAVRNVAHTAMHEMQWHEKSADKPWDFTNREYKVKPQSVEEYVESCLNHLRSPDEEDDWSNGQVEILRDVLKVIKENK